MKAPSSHRKLLMFANERKCCTQMRRSRHNWKIDGSHETRRRALNQGSCVWRWIKDRACDAVANTQQLHRGQEWRLALSSQRHSALAASAAGPATRCWCSTCIWFRLYRKHEGIAGLQTQVNTSTSTCWSVHDIYAHETTSVNDNFSCSLMGHRCDIEVTASRASCSRWRN